MNDSLFHIKGLMVVPNYYGFGGGSTNERQLTTFLSKKLERTHILSVDPFMGLLKKHSRKFYDKTEVNKTSILSLPMICANPVLIDVAMIFYSFIFAILASLLKITKKVDVIYVRGSLLAIGLCALKSILGLKPIALKFAAFASDEFDPRIRPSFLRDFGRTFFDAIDSYVLSKSDLIVVHSNEMKKEIKKRCLIGNKLLVLCPPGIDLDKINTLVKNIHRRTDEFRIGFLGNVSWWQGVDILVEAVSKIQKANPNVVLYIVGYGKDLEKTKLIAQKLSVKVVTTGYVRHDIALSHLKTFDVLVIPRRRSRSTRTNIPIKILEAFALGVPVIITKDKILLNMFRDYEDVLYVEPYSDDVAEKICRLISDEKLRKKLMNSGASLAKKFDYGHIVESLYRSFLEILRFDRT